MARSLSLSMDGDAPLQTHLDEFTSRFGIVLISLVLTSIFWWWYADIVLDWYLGKLSPCPPSECLRVFDPGAWISTRWMAILLLACLSTAPVLSWQAIRFTSPGLLPQEKIWLRRFLVLVPLVGAVTILATLAYALPVLFEWGHTQNQGQGLATRYDAAEFLRIAFTIAWVELLILMAVLAVFIAGTTGLLNEYTLPWWRLRVHGFLLGILWLILPDSLSGVRLTVVISSAILVEILLRTNSADIDMRQGLAHGKGILDAEGALRRIGIVDCTCAGGCPRMSQKALPMEVAGFSASALCLSPFERDLLLERIQLERWTDVIISGCDATPLPRHMHDSMSAIGVNLRGLNLLDFAASRPIPTSHPDLEAKLALAGLCDPWKVEGRRKRQLDALKTHTGGLEIFWSSSTGEMPWGHTLSPSAVFLKGGEPLGFELIQLMATRGWNIRNLDE